MESNAGPDGLVRAYRRARWGWITIAWGAIFLFQATRHCVDAHLAGRAASVPWLTMAGGSLALWAALTPGMLWLGRRASLDRDDRARGVAIHVAALLVIVVVDAAVQAWLWGDRGKSTFMSFALASFVIDGFSYATVIAIGHVQRSNTQYRERVRAEAALAQELTTARLRALEMQLQPHFLFNTLHAVGALVRSGRPDDAVRSLATLGDLLRATLTDGDQHEHALGDELALAHRYLELQGLRFGDRLRVELTIAPDAERARVPRLVLQPLLDNAVRHGVERSNTTVVIEVQARAQGERLELLVRDHGGQRAAPARGHGIGLANTRARLAALYGQAHTFEATSTEGGGLAVRIEIPLIPAAAPVRVPEVLELDGELVGDLEAAS
jgi:two-component system, LytTR family, sensor kinase